MGKLLDAFNYILSVISFALLIIPALLILIIIDLREENRLIKMFCNESLVNFKK